MRKLKTWIRVQINLIVKHIVKIRRKYLLAILNAVDEKLNYFMCWNEGEISRPAEIAVTLDCSIVARIRTKHKITSAHDFQ